MTLREDLAVLPPTDLEQFTGMLTRAGISYTTGPLTDPPGTKITITVAEWDEDSHVDGYDHFYTVFKFDLEGSLVIIGIWE